MELKNENWIINSRNLFVNANVFYQTQRKFKNFWPTRLDRVILHYQETTSLNRFDEQHYRITHF